MQYSCPSGRLILATFSRLALISSRKTCTDAVHVKLINGLSSTLTVGAWQLTTIAMRQENSKVGQTSVTCERKFHCMVSLL